MTPRVLDDEPCTWGLQISKLEYFLSRSKILLKYLSELGKKGREGVASGDVWHHDDG